MRLAPYLLRVILFEVALQRGVLQKAKHLEEVRYRLGGPPHPVTVSIMDNKDYIGVLLYSYYTTITAWGVLLRYRVRLTKLSYTA